MNKKIILSLSVIGIVAAIAVGGTYAYFSDTETSTGNTFTAGSINLNDGLSVTKFTLADLKPGDMGQGKYAISATSNNYWACMKSTIDTTPENGVLEAETGDATTEVGELQNYLNFFVWNDRDGDGVYTGNGTNPGTSEIKDRNLVGPIKLADLPGLGPLPLEDSTDKSFFGPNPLVAGTTYNLGIAYCFGTFAIDLNTKKLTCSGVGDQNIAQSDGVTGSTIFYAVQSDNNLNFKCSEATY